MVLAPTPFGRLGHQTLFDRLGRHSDVTDFAVHHRLDPLEVGQETPFGDGGDMSADAALFLGFAAAPNMTALNGADAS